jgi:DNA-binding response OmpR family regulator
MNKPNIVVITQDTSTQEEFRDILANEFEHLAAFNGVDGIALSRMTRPVIVFVDLNVPRLNAVGICKSLLSHEKIRSIPVIVLADTANVNGELKMLSNFKGVLQKPIQAQQVKSKIQLALEGKVSAEVPGEQKTGFKRESPIRVLSVDDSSVVRKLVTMILTAEGFKVTTAADGLDGINKAKESKPDVILLDFVMPKMNGFQVCRVLQKDEALSQIPIILVTSKGDKVGDKFVNQLGVTGYITKPFQPEELVSKIHQTLEMRQAQKESAPIQQMPLPSSPLVEAVESEHLENIAGTPVGVSVPQAVPQTTDSIKHIVQEEISHIFARDFERRVQGILKAEFDKFVKNLDKHIEKLVIEKMNEYIRRAKKK